MDNTQTKTLTDAEKAENSRMELYEETDKAVQSVLYRVLMYHIFGVDVYDHKNNPDIHELVGFRDNSSIWNPKSQKEIDNISGKYREPMNRDYDKLHNDFNVVYVEIGANLQFMKANQLYAIGKKIMAYDISKGFSEELRDIVGRNALERIYRIIPTA